MKILHFRCDEGWSGDDCSCDESESRCYSPYNKKTCSSHGVCECNRCRCDTAEDGRVFSGMIVVALYHFCGRNFKIKFQIIHL